MNGWLNNRKCAIQKLLRIYKSVKYWWLIDTFLRLGTTISYLEKLKKGKGEKQLSDTYSLTKSKFFNLGFDELQQVFIQDSSIEPLIPRNSKLNVQLLNPQEYKEKDIIALKYKKKMTARRFYKFDDIISLVPENKDHEIIYTKDISGLDIFGKVISYTASVG